jgi:ribose transport system ATP-binding protein
MDLAIENVSKSFPGVRALDGVSLDLKGGEIHALMGENGAGKSTLIKVITGVYRPDSGRILLDGKPVEFGSPRAALAAGIGAVHQERNLIPRFSVGENIMLERLPVRGGLVDYDAVHREARRFLDMLDRGIDTRVEVRTLSVAQMQIVEIAKALSLEARVLLLDEPTASITEHETAALFTLLRKLRAEGAAIVFVSHKLEEVFAIADRVTVLRDGRIAAANEPMAGMTRQRLVTLMVGREERVAQIRERPTAAADVVLEARGLSTSFGHRDVSFTLRRGEILGLYGLVGAGRSELARALFGAGEITGGELRVNGQPARIRSMHEALQKYRMGYISEDRKQEGLILMHSVRDNIAVTIWRKLAGALGLVAPRREARAVMPFVRRLEVRTPSISQTVGNLSGGNQQKVSIAKWLAAEARILVIDEPTVGIDIKTKTYIHELIGEIAADGVSVILISSDMPEMITLADRILVMHGFRIVGEVANDHRYETTSKAIMSRIHQVEETAA